MVQCDCCDLWVHFHCAGVTEAVKNVPWNCSKCSNQLQVPPRSDKKAPSKKGSSKKTGSKSDAGSETSRAASLELSIQQLELDQENLEKELEEQKLVHQKRLDMERKISEKRRAQQKEMLAKEKELMQQRLNDELEFLEQQKVLRVNFQRYHDKLYRQFEGSHVNDASKRENTFDKVNTWMNSVQQDPRGAYPKGCVWSKGTSDTPVPNLFHQNLLNSKAGNPGTDAVASKQQMRLQDESGGNPVVPPSKFIRDTIRPAWQQSLHENDDEIEKEREEVEEDSEQLPDLTEQEKEIIRNIVNRRRSQRTEFQQPFSTRGPTSEQLAARHAVSKHLPIFKGEPEVWPLFISSYEYTTDACGFTNTDNLKRLQDSLQGLAKEAVQSRLLLPESVPEVIEDLRQLFGSPEKLLKSLVAKVRKAPGPRIDKLESFLYFGITVKQLCDHLEAAKLHDHLNNPMLVQELVSKLPPEYKLDWVRFKRGKAGTPLRVFTDFTNGIVSEVSEVAEFSGLEVTRQWDVKGAKSKKKEFVYAHAAHNSPSNTTNLAGTKEKKVCPACKRKDHKLRFCDDFEKMGLQDRLRLVEKFKLCVLCLSEHGHSRCTFNVQCKIDHCKGKHHPLLHRTEELVQVTLHYGESSVNLNAFIDEGASATLLNNTIAVKLSADGVSEPLVVHWTSNVKRHEDQSKRLDLFVSARGSDTMHKLKGVRTVKELMLPKQGINLQDLTDRFEHLRGFPVNEYDTVAPQLLIGLDNLHLFAPLESRVGGSGEPIAVRSLLGWTIYGPDKSASSTKTVINHHSILTVTNQQLHEMLGKQYAIEDLSTSSIDFPESEEDKLARDILEKTTIRVGGRFETGLLWKNGVPDFPDSYPMAERRLKALEKRLSKNPELQQNVFQQIVEYQRKGYCHKATQAELDDTEDFKKWYLPLNVVQHPKKPGKVRLVWDAAATVNGVSLNSNLLKGPDLLTALPSVICKFREKPVAFGGDVREMYHQLRIREADKQTQRFLFRFDPRSPPEIYVMDVATFGSASSPCSAQFVKNLNAKEYATQFPEAAKAIVERHYVDDYYDSVDSEEVAVRRAKEVRFIHLKAGFEIRNWASNSENVLRELGESKHETTIHFQQDKITEKERVLGLIWDTKLDVFSFCIPTKEDVFAFDNRPTKRQVLSTVMSLFDPLGLLAPLTVLGKMLIQDLWRTGCDWDELICEDTFSEWKRWIELLRDVELVKIPRPYFGSTLSTEYHGVQLHVFCDAGEKAFGCAGYFRIVVGGRAICSLVMARTKVSPLKQLTIPRLELQAAVLAAKLAKAIRQYHSLKVEKVFFWTDSQTVLSWIRSDQRKYKQFVGFRIGSILSLTNVTDWRWTPSKLNVADHLTKWDNMPSMLPDGQWFRGLDFLYEAEQQWPKQVQPQPNTTTEMRAIFLLHDIVLIEPFIDANRISKWNVLVRTVACLYRFISNCRRKHRGQPIEAFTCT
ncbi:uncharacterized protein LOC131433878 [Malaya genurostris]|uniref:uncharacterized protein LOC131433878 n=1 Tax=Malaya genurostris TaxID=325434 RepID=UPI0026F3FA0E|nr:uncharacterized protein LOC131433878 [Malaya genurostris]